MMTWNWFAIFGWAIVLFIGSGVLQRANNIDKRPKEALVNEAFGIIITCLICIWIVVAIQRGS